METQTPEARLTILLGFEDCSDRKMVCIPRDLLEASFCFRASGERGAVDPQVMVN